MNLSWTIPRSILPITSYIIEVRGRNGQYYPVPGCGIGTMTFCTVSGDVLMKSPISLRGGELIHIRGKAVTDGGLSAQWVNSSSG